jgi:hypothetical protein
MLLNQINQANNSHSEQLQKLARMIRQAADALRGEAAQLDTIARELVGEEPGSPELAAVEKSLNEMLPALGMQTKYKGRHLDKPLPTAED